MPPPLPTLKGEDKLNLDSGHLFYFREGDGFSQGEVGFLFYKTLTKEQCCESQQGVDPGSIPST